MILIGFYVGAILTATSLLNIIASHNVESKTNIVHIFTTDCHM